MPAFSPNHSTTNFIFREAWVSMCIASTMYKLDGRVIFEKSAHFVQWNEPTAFFEKVKEFIDKNK